MPRTPIDLNAFTSLRTKLEQLAVRQRKADTEMAAARQALDVAVRSGAAPAEVARLNAGIAAAQSARNSLADQRRALNEKPDAQARAAAVGIDPAALVASMDGKHPIALLPMRLETRYISAPGIPTRLRIRIYPDDLNTIDHEPTPTDTELQSGMAYWRARFVHDDDEGARLLRDLTTSYGRGRASWLIRVLTPINPLPAPDVNGEPEFPPTDTIDSLAKTTRAVLLPERFCAIGYAAGRREVFRVWGNTIPDELQLSPDWLATDKPEALLGGERAWMVDFDAALAKGMAIEVSQAQIEVPPPGAVFRPFNLATDTIERLVVVGFEWTKNAAESATDFVSLLAAHRDSTGLGFAALGMPTNNTEAAPAGYSPSMEKLPAAPAPGNSPEDQDALQLLTWACGIAPEALPADNIENAHLTDQRSALHMMNLLWRGTFGDYLLQMWNPIDDKGNPRLSSKTLYALRNYAATYVRPSGALPILRVNKQPYGMLPLVGRRFVDAGDYPVETAVNKLTGVLRPMWEIASASVPQLVDGDVDKAKDILQTAAWSQTAYYRDKDVKAVCMEPTPFSDAQTNGRLHLIRSLVSALGPYDYWDVHIGVCNDFLPDPPYSAGYLAGVPWVLANDKDPTKEAADATTLGSTDTNYLARLSMAASQGPAGKPYLDASQAGAELLKALAAYSVQKEQGDAVDGVSSLSGAVNRVISMATTTMP